MKDPVRTRLRRNGGNGWYWEVVTTDGEVLQRGVTFSLEAARAQADRATQAAAKRLELESQRFWRLTA
jgi:hypothetical protein